MTAQELIDELAIRQQDATDKAVVAFIEDFLQWVEQQSLLEIERGE